MKNLGRSDRDKEFVDEESGPVKETEMSGGKLPGLLLENGDPGESPPVLVS
jgi:hypothetical protein